MAITSFNQSTLNLRAPNAAVIGNTPSGSYSSGGSSYEYVRFTASGTLTVEIAGLVDVLVLGAGSGGDSGGYANMGGGGKIIYQEDFLIAAGSHTVTIGAAVACSNTVRLTAGNPSSIGTFLDTGYAGKSIGAGGLPTSDAAYNQGFTSDITGTSVVYGAAAVSSPAANTGQGSYSYFNNPSGSGVVVVRVKV